MLGLGSCATLVGIKVVKELDSLNLKSDLIKFILLNYFIFQIQALSQDIPYIQLSQNEQNNKLTKENKQNGCIKYNLQNECELCRYGYGFNSTTKP